MVYIHSWQEFQEAAEALYEKSPNQARYCVKWKSLEGKLVLKITDNTTCIKFKTYSSIFLNRFEALNLSLMQKIQNRRVKEEPQQISEPRKPDADRASPMPGTTPAAAGPSAGGVAKKKKPKKKK
ncbi:Signal recognition particle, SRP9/SRP14 subunit [Amanita muscaria]